MEIGKILRRRLFIVLKKIFKKSRKRGERNEQLNRIVYFKM